MITSTFQHYEYLKQSTYHYKKQKQNKSEIIFKKCLEQIKQFTQWKQKNKWDTFHQKYYDWWAFPINQKSSYRDKYKVYPQDKQLLQLNPQFMTALQENCVMKFQAWGYDLQKGQHFKNSHTDKKWQDQPIRLYKITKSLELFQFKHLHKNAVKYAFWLINQGYSLEYSGKNKVQSYFQKKIKEFNLSKQNQINEQQILKEQQKIVEQNEN